jgi:nickel-dependent lactate racemase
MFGIYEVGERGLMKSPKDIEQPYKHTINSKQLSDQINKEDRVVVAT